VLGVAWKRDSRTLVSAGADKVIKVWDFVTGDRRKNIEGADTDVTGVAYVGVTDQMVATSGDNQVRLLKESGEKVRSFEGPADFMNTAAATPDGRVIAAGGQDGRLLLWNGTTGSPLGSFEPEN
jgi:WD40 repeat protein